jgi:zinc protease
MSRRLQGPLLAGLLGVWAIATAAPMMAEERRARQFTLDNGLEITVVPDRRAPVVTHMLVYRAGAADDPRGRSGLTHFVEHLMFKATDTLAPGEFSRTVSRLGGRDNAVTNHDATIYYQRVHKDRLRRVMELEADRMVNLRITEDDVRTELGVIVEERRGKIDASPIDILNEQVAAALYLNHPYGLPVLGWEHEMSQLTRADALAFYKRFYGPQNAFLLILGDVEPEAAEGLARETYGRVARTLAAPGGARRQEPEHRAPRRLEVRDTRVANPAIYRTYLAPSRATTPPGEAEALEVLMRILAQGETSRLHGRLVAERRLAVVVEGGYAGLARDSGEIAVYALARETAALADIEAEIDAALADIAERGVTADELERARGVIEAKLVYDADNQQTLARRYADALVAGAGLADVEQQLTRLSAVTVEDVQKAAARHLRPERSVTGLLLPAGAERLEARAPVGQR